MMFDGRHVAMHDLQGTSPVAPLRSWAWCSPAATAAAMCTHTGSGHPLAGRHRALEQRAHGVAVDVLHRQEVGLVLAPDLEHPGDVGVVQRRRHPRLVEEHLHELLVVAAVARDDLDHDLAAPRPRAARCRAPGRSRPCRRWRGAG
jgi:hypothetical protein